MSVHLVKRKTKDVGILCNNFKSTQIAEEMSTSQKPNHPDVLSFFRAASLVISQCSKFQVQFKSVYELPDYCLNQLVTTMTFLCFNVN